MANKNCYWRPETDDDMEWLNSLAKPIKPIKPTDQKK